MLMFMPASEESRIIWQSDDGVIRCTEIAHASARDVTIVVADETVSSRRFTDITEAARETDRLRKLFIG